MKRLGYYNGKIGSLEEMTIPMNDRAGFFGDGVYDAGLSRNCNVFAMEEHLDRFFGNAQKLRIEVPVTKDELRSTLNELVKQVDDSDVFVYYQVTRGTGVRQHVFTEGPGNLWITIIPAKIPDGTKAIKLITAEDTRWFHNDIKTLNLIPAVMASQKAKEAGCEEAVLYRPGGRVTECAHSNVHILQGGVLRTAPTDNLILPGIARAHLIKACHALGIPVREEAFSLDEMYAADEIIITSSSKLCMFADEIDRRQAGRKDPETMEAIRAWIIDEFNSQTQ